MSTAQDLLNNVLRGLRRDVLTTASTTNSYQLMLLQYLNIAKSQIEQKWAWMALRQTVTVTIAASTQVFTLSAAGAADVDVIEGSRLLYEKHSQFGDSEVADKDGGAVPQVWDTTDSDEYRLEEIPWEQFERLRLTDDNETTDKPQAFALRYTGGYYQLGLWPMASGSRTLSMRFVIPQADIPNTAMTAYTLTIPSQPVWMRALWMAAEERGEDVGRPLSTLEREADDSLFYALDRERTEYDNTISPI